MYAINGFPVITKENFSVFTTLCSHLISNTKCLIHVVHTVSILGYIEVKWLVPKTQWGNLWNRGYIISSLYVLCHFE